jgi:hypothetical protein
MECPLSGGDDRKQGFADFKLTTTNANRLLLEPVEGGQKTFANEDN